MAKSTTNPALQSKQIMQDVKNGKFAPVYLLQGEEAYYPELVCQCIIDNCIAEYDKDFNESIYFGSSVKAEHIVAAARRFPMMADRQLVVVKDAQNVSDLENISTYLTEPLDTTVLVLLLRSSSLDKRKTLYKEIVKKGIVLDSPLVRDYEISEWIVSYFRSLSIDISPSAASLLSEASGTDLSTIVMEGDKLMKSLPVGTNKITVEDIERNVGISRQYSIFELTKELSSKNNTKALKIASHIGNSAKFSMPGAITVLYNHFNRILKYSYLKQKGFVSSEDKSKALSGVNPYFYKEYDTAVSNYPLQKSMAIISLLCEYDYLSKGGDGQVINQAELLRELTAKILCI